MTPEWYRTIRQIRRVALSTTFFTVVRHHSRVTTATEQYAELHNYISLSFDRWDANFSPDAV